MDKDLVNFKKWLQNLGMEMDDKIDDEVIRKLMPPQRRDMWRSIMKYVLPKEEVELIKKSLLLHKLQKRQKPLMAKVESDEDYANALKYEELITEYNKIQKDIIDTKIVNSKLKTNLNETNESMKNLVQNTKLNQNKYYLTKHKKEYYNKFIEELNEMSNICKHFSSDANEDFTKTDYEDSLIKCFTEVDDAKQSGTMNEGVNIGKKLSNVLYTNIRDKSPVVLIQTLEENLMKHINNSKEIIMETNKTNEVDNDDENVFNEIITKLFEIQLQFKSKLSNTLIEKERVINHLKETKNLVEHEIINQYKLKNLSCTDHELLQFKKNLKEALLVVTKNSVENSKTIELEKNINHKEETFKMLDDISMKINQLNEELDQKKNSVCEMLKELNNKKTDFGLLEVKSVMDKLAESYLEKVNDIQMIDDITTSIKDACISDIDCTNKLTTMITPKAKIINFQDLQNIEQQSQMVKVISEVASKFEHYNNILTTENGLNEIEHKEHTHKLEFNNVVSEIEKKMSELKSSIDDSQIIADIVLNKQLQNASEDLNK